MERTGRAYARGATGEIVAAPVSWAVQQLPRLVPSVFKAAEALKPVLTATEPVEGTLAHWWQTVAKGGAGNVVREWDALTAAEQAAKAGAQRGDVATLVNTLRATETPLIMQTPTQLATSTGLGTAVSHAGHPWLGTAIGAASAVTRQQAPKLLLYPRPASFIASLPQAGRVASSFVDPLLRAGGQTGAVLEWPTAQPTTP
jgi:hypothetical protein